MPLRTSTYMCNTASASWAGKEDKETIRPYVHLRHNDKRVLPTHRTYKNTPASPEMQLKKKITATPCTDPHPAAEEEEKEGWRCTSKRRSRGLICSFDSLV